MGLSNFYLELEQFRINYSSMGVILGFARNGEPSRAPQHAPKIILGALLLCTLDIKIARIVLIFNLVLVLHAPLPKKHFIITYFEATFLLLSKLVLNWHLRNDSVMSFLWRLYVRDSILLIYFFPKNFTYETNNIQHLNKATILRPLYLRDINDCFCICSNNKITLHRSAGISFIYECKNDIKNIVMSSK